VRPPLSAIVSPLEERFVGIGDEFRLAPADFGRNGPNAFRIGNTDLGMKRLPVAPARGIMHFPRAGAFPLYVMR